MYYPANLANIDICAYHPSSVTSGTTEFTVNASQTTANVANYRSSDLMYATKLTNKAKGTTHGLTFNHALSKIVVNLTGGGDVTIDTIAKYVSSVTIKNTLPTAGFTISNGAVGAITASGSATDIEITGTNKANHTGIIVPQTLAAATVLFNVVYNNVNYTWALEENTTFEKGKVYTYNLTLSTVGIELESTEINDWNSEGIDDVLGAVTL